MDMCRNFGKVPVFQFEFSVRVRRPTIYSNPFAVHMDADFFPSNIYPIARHYAKAAEVASNSFHQQNRMSYVSDDAVVEPPFH